MEIVLDRESTAEVGHGEGVAVAVYVDDRLVRHRGANATSTGEADDVGSSGDPTQLFESLDCIHVGQYESDTTDSPVEEGPRRSFYHDLLAAD